jgi:hypothetical protein
MENYAQAIFDIQPKGSTLVVGGDGRCFSSDAIQLVIGIAAANDVTKLIVGTDGIFSTPAASDVIRKYKADGGILLTASRNPGELNEDLGIKYNVSNGGLAPENITNKIFEKTKTISEYQGFSDGHESIPHGTHAHTQHGVRQSGEGECKEASVADRAALFLAFPPLPLSPISLLRFLLLSFSLSLYSPVLALFLQPLFILSHTSSNKQIIRSRVFDLASIATLNRSLLPRVQPPFPCSRPSTAK